MYSPAELVADADRELAIEELRGHMLVGRLTAEDFEARVGSVHRARTRADLDAVQGDLPVVQRRVSPGVPSESASA